jgi:hypothetical protein
MLALLTQGSIWPNLLTPAMAGRRDLKINVKGRDTTKIFLRGGGSKGLTMSVLLLILSCLKFLYLGYSEQENKFKKNFNFWYETEFK